MSVIPHKLSRPTVTFPRGKMRCSVLWTLLCHWSPMWPWVNHFNSPNKGSQSTQSLGSFVWRMVRRRYDLRQVFGGHQPRSTSRENVPSAGFSSTPLHCPQIDIMRRIPQCLCPNLCEWFKSFDNLTIVSKCLVIPSHRRNLKVPLGPAHNKGLFCLNYTSNYLGPLFYSNKLALALKIHQKYFKMLRACLPSNSVNYTIELNIYKIVHTYMWLSVCITKEILIQWIIF